MLGVVSSKLKVVKNFMQNLWILDDVVVAWPGSSNNVAPRHTFQHIATHRNRLAKRAQQVLWRYVVLKCCDHLVGACKCLANDVVIW